MTTDTITPATSDVTLDGWELSFEIVDAPVAVPTGCDSGDGCGTTCESACTSD
ncbi:hypothetical protein GCM10027059_37280 [Myceligenerans halotolerans]